MFRTYGLWVGRHAELSVWQKIRESKVQRGKKAFGHSVRTRSLKATCTAGFGGWRAPSGWRSATCN